MRGEFLVTNMLTGNFLLSHLSVWGRGGGVERPEDEVDETKEGGDKHEDDEGVWIMLKELVIWSIFLNRMKRTK